MTPDALRRMNAKKEPGITAAHEITAHCYPVLTEAESRFASGNARVHVFARRVHFPGAIHCLGANRRRGRAPLREGQIAHDPMWAAPGNRGASEEARLRSPLRAIPLRSADCEHYLLSAASWTARSARLLGVLKSGNPPGAEIRLAHAFPVDNIKELGYGG